VTGHNSESLPRGRSDIVFRQLDEEWVLFDPRATKLHALNLAAALIWAHCDGTYTRGRIAEVLAATFDSPVPLTQARDDVDATLTRFQEAGLLEGR